MGSLNASRRHHHAITEQLSIRSLHAWSGEALHTDLHAATGNNKVRSLGAMHPVASVQTVRTNARLAFRKLAALESGWLRSGTTHVFFTSGTSLAMIGCWHVKGATSYSKKWTALGPAQLLDTAGARPTPLCRLRQRFLQSRPPTASKSWPRSHPNARQGATPFGRVRGAEVASRVTGATSSDRWKKQRFFKHT